MGGILFHPLTFILLFLAIIVGSQIELGRIIFPDNRIKHLARSLLISVPAYLLSPFIAAGIFSDSILLLSVLIIILILISELYSGGKDHFLSLSKVLMIVVYTTMPYIFMAFSAFGSGTGFKEFSPGMVASFFVLLWINDTGAYLFGITFGKYKLFESISPKKTWEGFAGGALLTIVAAWFIGHFLGSYSQYFWVLAGLIVSVFGTFGDLFESLIKREYGIKDSGSMLPGHGGFLDRFDGITFAFPALYLFITFFG